MTNLVLLEQEVDLDPKLIPALAERLAQKRASLEKEIDALGEEPKNQGIAAIFTQCRGFATVFEKLINDTDKAARIRELFHGDGGLLGKVKKINWKKEFRPEVVKRVCKTADGYQPHLISPEKGLQTLASDALEQNLLKNHTFRLVKQQQHTFSYTSLYQFQYQDVQNIIY
eukprot:TRINITY_DN2850_c1_g1_i7.p4 TRINITY_DN2850_c1_g1~~TRINITY_DN2850_c1_g1_i7.p4  ORF type:complete len:171 (-),score=19.62 TRINITY_DN2850_c1_g1_i7:433-945(-)